jgi:DHA1 family tetracycline resistance protein-like MFS transporter
VHRRTPALGFVFLTLLLDTLGFGLIIPVAPRLIEHLHGGAEKEAAPIVGWLGATYALMQFLFAPVLGALSDRFGRRPVLLVSMFGSGLDYLAMALAPNVTWLFVTRALNGLSGASMTTASAYVADITPPEKRAAGFGVVGAAFGLGFVLGPLLGGWLGDHDLRLPFWLAGIVTLLNWLYGLLILPESLPRERRQHRGRSRNPVKALARLAHYPLALRLSGALLLLNLAQFALQGTWALYTQFRYEWSSTQIGSSLFAVGIGAVVVQGFLAKRIIARLGERRSLLLGIGIGVVAYLGYGLAERGWMVFCVIVYAAFSGIGMPACQSLITKSVRADEQGTVQGGLTAIQSLAMVLGPLLGTNVFAWSIGGARVDSHPAVVLFTSSALAAVGWVVALLALRRTPAAPVPAPPPAPLATPTAAQENG